MYLERVRNLPAEVQAEIATRVSKFVELAKTADDELLARFIQVARDEQRRAGVKSEIDPLRAAPALSEAWCNATLGLATGKLDPHSAVEIIVAIEKFTAKRAAERKWKAR